MIVKVRYFARIRDLVGRQLEEVDVADDCDVAQLLKELGSRHPEVVPQLFSDFEEPKLAREYRILVNGVPAGVGDRLRGGDELAIIPPVAGG